MTIIHNQYVDELPWSKIVQDGIRGAVEGLDADSTVVEARKPAGAGHVGMRLTQRRGALAVVAMEDDRAAGAACWSWRQSAPIDRIETRSLSVGDAAERLQGAPGSRSRSACSVPAGPSRGTSRSPAKPPEAAVRSRALGAGVLYVRLPEITGRTPADLQRSIGAAPGPVTGLVLDLRNTVGGDVRAVPAVASLFLDPG